jgi:hypothetical protein
LPHLKITGVERYLFENEPVEFVKTVCDMSDKQSIKIPKNRAIRLLETMTEYIDNFLFFIVDFYLNLMIFTINKSNSSLSLTYTFPDNFVDRLSCFSDEDVIENVLQVFSSLSFIIYEKKSLIGTFEDKLESVNSYLIKINSDFLKAKLCNFYSYTLDDMYHDKTSILSKAFDDSINFLFECLTNENGCITLNFMALEALESLIFDEELIILVHDFIKIHLKRVLALVGKEEFNELTTYPIFHRFIKNILCKNFQEIGENLQKVFLYFWNNIKCEIDSFIRTDNQVLSAKKMTNLTDMINCVTKLIENSKTTEYKHSIYFEIFQLFDQVDRLINYDYEEDIYNLLIIIINDIKLIPNEYINSLDKLFKALDDDKKDYIESYHISFILSFISNIKYNEYYKGRLLNLIEAHIFEINKSHQLMKTVLVHVIYTNLLIGYIMVIFINSALLAIFNKR